ncbi:MAG: hypothetical protein ABSF10_16015 [Verrucomicrobiota bacterium]
MTILRGKVCRGFGKAGSCLPDQIKHLKDSLPEITSMYTRGTLNVELENPVRFSVYDFIFPNVKWREDYPPETFKIIKARLLLEVENNKPAVPCLLYFPSTSTHRANPFMLEIITEKLDLTGVNECFVCFSHQSRRADWVIFGDRSASPKIQ